VNEENANILIAALLNENAISREQYILILNYKVISYHEIVCCAAIVLLICDVVFVWATLMNGYNAKTFGENEFAIVFFGMASKISVAVISIFFCDELHAAILIATFLFYNLNTNHVY
jgi:hypothetical protein